jgi:hypothetical protein
MRGEVPGRTAAVLCPGGVGLSGVARGWERPPGVHPWDRVGLRTVLHNAADAEEDCRDACCSLHPAESRRQQRFGCVMLDEPPVRLGPPRARRARRGCRPTGVRSRGPGRHLRVARSPGTRRPRRPYRSSAHRCPRSLGGGERAGPTCGRCAGTCAARRAAAGWRPPRRLPGPGRGRAAMCRWHQVYATD